MTNKKTSGCYRLLQTADWDLGKMLNEQSRDQDHAKLLEWLLLAVNDGLVASGRITKGQGRGGSVSLA